MKRQLKPTPPRQYRALAELIAREMFTSGTGTKAERLLLWLDSKSIDLGGWSEKPFAASLEALLLEWFEGTR